MDGLPVYYLHIFGNELRGQYAKNSGRILEFGIVYDILEDSPLKLVLRPLREIEGFISKRLNPKGLESKVFFFNAENHIGMGVNVAAGVLVEYALETNDFKCSPQDGVIILGREIKGQGIKTIVKSPLA